MEQASQRAHSRAPRAGLSTRSAEWDKYPEPEGSLTTPPLSPLLAPASPRKSPFLVPLDRLVPAGVIVLEAHELAPASESALELEPPQEDDQGWSRLTWTSLQPIVLPPELEFLFAPIAPPPPPPSPLDLLLPLAPSPSSSSPKKRKSTASSTPRKKPRIKAPPRLLDDLLALQDALVVRATFRVVDDGSTALVRVYLVPTDLDERKLERVERTAKARPADSTVVRVLAAVRTGKASWEGDVGGVGPSLLDDPDKRSLLELYRSVPSPPSDLATLQTLSDLTPTILDRLEDALADSTLGLKTELFPYQRASLTKMLARELVPQRHPSPAYDLTHSSIDGRRFYVSVGGDVRLDPPTFEEPKGGVLAEEMGTGKTVICLALILSTQGALPSLSSVRTYLDGTPSPPPLIMTPMALTLPFSSYHTESLRGRPRVPPPLLGYERSTVEIEEHAALLLAQSLSDSLLPPKPFPSLRQLLVHLIKSRAVPYDPLDPRLEGSELGAELAQNTPFYSLYPSPEQLERSREGRKGSYGPVKILVSTTSLVVVPTDLVRQWKGELEKHVEEGQLKVLVLRTVKDKFPSPEELVTYDAVILSVVRFSDAANDPESPLRQIHWKRLFVDEGHALSGANQLRKLAEELHCECRWAISGTPTTNLRGQDDEGALFSRSSTSGGSEVDYQRLGEIYSRFLHHPAFSKPDLWRSVVTVPLLQDGRGAARLADILGRSLVRNDPERIKEAYTLPALTTRVTYLDFLEEERKTYNSLLAVFAVNSIQTQRVDQDYLFAPQNRKYLDELTLNLGTSSVFFAASTTYGRMWDAIKYSQERLASEKSAAWTPEDRLGQQKAIEVMQEALADRQWRHVMQSQSIAFDVSGLDPALVKSYRGLSPLDAQDRTLVPSSQLVQLRTNLKEVRRPTVGAFEDEDELVEELITFEEKRVREIDTPAVEPDPPATTPKRKRKAPGEVERLLPLPEDSQLSKVEVGATTSAKLNYVIAEVQRYPEDKFIVFSSTLSDLVFAQLSEAFDIVGIPHAIFAGHARKRDRGATAAEFNASPASKCRAILVDAKMGGRGMQLAGANRVIMLEPIWLPDLEVQAAKRAHRLGQTKPVDLQVLVIKNSYEDALLMRRGQLGQADFAKTKQPQRDSKLRDLLQAAEYLEPTGATPDLATRVKLIRPDPVSIESATRDFAEVTEEEEEAGAPPRKKTPPTFEYSYFEKSAPPKPEESGSRERLDLDTPQLGRLGAGDGLGAGGNEVQGLSKERSSAVNPESSSIIKATRTEQYFHLQLQLAHLERVLALLATSHESQIEGRQVLGEINALPHCRAEEAAFSKRQAELQATFNTQQDLWQQAADDLINHSTSISIGG
ncbi:hypothetical protein RQP46_005294 [Phenoliferia psychrophenolica]